MQPPTRTLVLTPWMTPHRIVPWERAVTLWYEGKVEVLASYDVDLRSPSTTIKMPAVIRVKKPTPAMKKSVKFSRSNVLARDNWTCCFCGQKLPSSKLNYDHVVPRSRRGKTNFENVVTSCYPCNRKKGNRTPAEAGMTMRYLPHRPRTLPLLPLRIERQEIPAEWSGFLGRAA